MDVIIIGAGAAGLMCALQSARRGLKVLLLEHNEKIGGKILISGGGRCNFTNLGTSPSQFVSRDSTFCSSALARFPAQKFIQMLKEHHIPFHEKKLGQLFCDRSARDIVQMFDKECAQSKVEILLGCSLQSLTELPSPENSSSPRFKILSSRGNFTSRSVVIATGGLSLPQIGATGLGYDIAKQFGLKIVPRHPALDGFLFSEEDSRAFSALSGISLGCRISCGNMTFLENILFTHKGLSGPAALQISLHWHPGDPIEIDLCPQGSALDWLNSKKKSSSRMLVKNILAERLPARFCDYFSSLHLSPHQTLQDLSEAQLKAFSQQLHHWRLFPKSTVGYNKAEVTRGGVATSELSPQTMEALKRPGLFFIGEVVDVTGWLGGYNFQWAWASAWAAAQALEKALP